MSSANEHQLGPEAQFLARLDDLGVALWVGTVPEYGNAECSRPLDWQKLTWEENLDRLARFHFDYAPFICANTGPVASVDVDTKNGGDIEKVRALLARLKVRIFAEIDTPSGGKHFDIKGHPDLPTVHSKADNPKLPSFPGVDIQSGKRVLPGHAASQVRLHRLPGRLRRTRPVGPPRRGRRRWDRRAGRVGGRAVGAQR